MDAWYTRHLHRQINFQYKVSHRNDKFTNILFMHEYFIFEK